MHDKAIKCDQCLKLESILLEIEKISSKKMETYAGIYKGFLDIFTLCVNATRTVINNAQPQVENDAKIQRDL